MSDSADRRAAERIPVVSATRCSVSGRVVDDVGSVKIRDVSLEGIGLLLGKAVPVGTTLLISLSNPDKGFKRQMLVKIVHVTPIPGAFLAGGTFADPLTYQELTTLVM